ncbi:uncharacterized protein B0T15DRAFT_489751 [Chaetomium strumarium]|uniref:BZIP domain-containing protein n=1 Tax=Chaetomium strumarium TaxID=1170767 RepID=A0AAJ0H3F7_9PEZI|nr:hypothetical protein B0T15DRAFT_489751 [Chaetomium strumarium]
MTSLSPSQPPQPGFGEGPSGHDGTPLSTLNIDFIRTLAGKRVTRDGQPPKRRGPKPDSRPALTRRQELNRQAQRTHRERKELYIKALEDEVLRLKEIFSNISKDKEKLAEENRQLKALLVQDGSRMAALTGGSNVLEDSMSNLSVGHSPNTSMTGSYMAASSNTNAFSAPISVSSGGRSDELSPRSAIYPSGYRHLYHQHSQQEPLSTSLDAGDQPNENPVLDYEQAGIDFVLTLERPCMNHLPWLLERSAESGSHHPCGHALMASCPPEPFSKLPPDMPFGHHRRQTHHHHHHHHHDAHMLHHHSPGNGNGNGSVGRGPNGTPAEMATWTLTKADLATLLDLSKRLNLDGEITPVMAWGMVLAHPRAGELSLEDLGRLTEELSGKVRCYGFGAVLEEFEVRDALENVLSTKPEFGTRY